MVEKSKTEEIIELVNKLFVYTDEMNWKKLLQEVFSETVVFDMSSVGGAAPEKLKATAITEKWKTGFEGIDAVYHQAGNHIVSIKDEGHAEVFCYAFAVHYREDASKGTTREFYGTYEVVTVLTDVGWRINGLRYKLKFLKGNKNLV